MYFINRMKQKSEKIAAMLMFFVCTQGHAFAQSVGFSGDTLSIEWPWMKFFNSLAAHLTGPLPFVLGIMGIAGCAFSLFGGHSGGGSQKFILLIFVISVCLFAPTFMSMIQESAGGLTIMGIRP